MNYAKINKYDITNGVGVRTSLFVSGCWNNCEGCFNKELQDFNYGNHWTKEVEDEFIEYCKDENVVGVSLLGGEPMQQDSTLLDLLDRINDEVKKPIWMWTGLVFEDLIENDFQKQVLTKIDILIDGEFILNKRDLKLKYRGSSNQRVILVKETLKRKEIVTMEGV